MLLRSKQRVRRKTCCSLPVCGNNTCCNLPVCGKTDVRSSKKPRSSRKRPNCIRRDRDSPADVTKSPPPEDPPTADVTESSPPEDPPTDVITMDIPDSGDTVPTADGMEAQMSDEERRCYNMYMNKKLDEYEPIWVSFSLSGSVEFAANLSDLN